MSVCLELANCPRCGDTPSVFIRDIDDLVCTGCLVHGHPMHTPRSATAGATDGDPVACQPPPPDRRHSLRRIL